MNREIKFRGQRIDNGEWVNGYLANSGHQINPHIEFWWIAQNRYDYGTIFDERSCDDTFIWRRVDPETVGQYTGLKDKNGVEIYEGDIVRYTRTNMYAPETSFNGKDLVSIHEIYWNKKEFAFAQHHYSDNRCVGGGNIKFDDDRAKDNIIEVIGNIYDNPELLEKEL